MQLPNAPEEALFPQIENALQSQRLQRYMPAAQQQKTLAFQYYIWNGAISEAFYLPLQFSEIVCRNAIHNALLFHLGENWFDHGTLRNLLDPRFRSDLAKAIAEEGNQHGDKMTAHHVASALSFGFWEHLTTKRFQRLIWKRGIRHNFPGAHFSNNLNDLHNLIESVRRWRNRIAHHNAIFDKNPTGKYQDTIDLINWVCADTLNWVKSFSKVPQAISLRPKDPAAEGAAEAQ